MEGETPLLGLEDRADAILGGIEGLRDISEGAADGNVGKRVEIRLGRTEGCSLGLSPEGLAGATEDSEGLAEGIKTGTAVGIAVEGVTVGTSDTVGETAVGLHDGIILGCIDGVEVSESKEGTSEGNTVGFKVGAAVGL